ncbi:LPXTG cell wall anchor domain-containing protein [Streptomyces sp. 8K308]|uniref:LPXTG cell wall anchor domain-containing protein n=1 Tax=Streptomyces sp. 8K308 TaxID=2530388 RepID=UPI001046575C|nr:LPXTG cell wall anchor domain-containing protein [Streptomyces sp. 8K308]TDC26476.1 LPXTG cell wall anchor domain-containing protein [Streptomyces sp. 8K308]
MRKLTLLGTVTAAGALLIAGATPALAAEHEVGLHQNPPITADDPEFAGREDCPTIPADQDGWHFVLPTNDATFLELRVTFEQGGEQVITDFGPPSDKHAYVASAPGDTLIAASATVEGGPADFRLSHTCPATEASDAPEEQEPATEEPEEPGEEAPETQTPATGADEGGAGEEPSAEPIPATDEDADLAETGSNTPVVAASAGAAVLLAIGGYLALRRRGQAHRN